MTDKKQIPVYLTQEQVAALDAVTDKFGRSAFIRDALKVAVESAGVDWPDNMPEIWEHMRPPKN